MQRQVNISALRVLTCRTEMNRWAWSLQPRNSKTHGHHQSEKLCLTAWCHISCSDLKGTGIRSVDIGRKVRVLHPLQDYCGNTCGTKQLSYNLNIFHDIKIILYICIKEIEDIIILKIIPENNWYNEINDNAWPTSVVILFRVCVCVW
jgi:hypothetical protein